MTNDIKINREAWLQRAIEALTPIFSEAGYAPCLNVVRPVVSLVPASVLATLDSVGLENPVPPASTRYLYVRHLKTLLPCSIL
jgi:hypothetical protein